MVLIESEAFYLQELNNKRIRCALLKHMKISGFEININSIHDNTDAFLQKVKDFIKCCTQIDANIKHSSLKDQLKYLTSLVNNDMIPLDTFAWLKDDRACYFTWLEIQTKINIDIYSTVTNIYQCMKLSTSCLNSKERLDLVISFFDLWLTSNNEKLAYLENIKSTYQNNLERHLFKGLNKKDSEQIQWYYQYIKNYLKKYNSNPVITLPTVQYNSNQLAFHINPTTDEETYHLIYALYDTWDFYILGDRTNFKETLSKAYSQRKFRKKQEGKKPLNTYLKKETKDKLEQLREYYRNATLHDTLDLIIREAYEQTLGNGQRK